MPGLRGRQHSTASLWAPCAGLLAAAREEAILAGQRGPCRQW
jgi:hypothetical protein